MLIDWRLMPHHDYAVTFASSKSIGERVSIKVRAPKDAMATSEACVVYRQMFGLDLTNVGLLITRIRRLGRPGRDFPRWRRRRPEWHLEMAGSIVAHITPVHGGWLAWGVIDDADVALFHCRYLWLAKCEVERWLDARGNRRAEADEQEQAPL
jgi:hypothetical protein